MATYNPAMQKARIADIPADVHGLISKKTAELDGVAVTEVTFHPGARWSKDLKAYAGTDLCELPHVALVTAGTLRVLLRDGSQEDFSAGEVMLLPPRPRRLDGRRPAVHLRRILPGQRLLQLGSLPPAWDKTWTLNKKPGTLHQLAVTDAAQRRRSFLQASDRLFFTVRNRLELA